VWIWHYAFCYEPRQRQDITLYWGSKRAAAGLWPKSTEDGETDAVWFHITRTQSVDVVRVTVAQESGRLAWRINNQRPPAEETAYTKIVRDCCTVSICAIVLSQKNYWISGTISLTYNISPVKHVTFSVKTLVTFTYYLLVGLLAVANPSLTLLLAETPGRNLVGCWCKRCAEAMTETRKCGSWITWVMG